MVRVSGSRSDLELTELVLPLSLAAFVHLPERLHVIPGLKVKKVRFEVFFKEANLVAEISLHIFLP